MVNVKQVRRNTELSAEYPRAQCQGPLLWNLLHDEVLRVPRQPVWNDAGKSRGLDEYRAHSGADTGKEGIRRNSNSGDKIAKKEIKSYIRV